MNRHRFLPPSQVTGVERTGGQQLTGEGGPAAKEPPILAGTGPGCRYDIVAVHTLASGQGLTSWWAQNLAPITGDHHAVVALQGACALASAEDAVGEVALPDGGIGVVETVPKLAHLQGKAVGALRL